MKRNATRLRVNRETIRELGSAIIIADHELRRVNGGVLCKLSGSCRSLEPTACLTACGETTC
jgi:hypothetical protein